MKFNFARVRLAERSSGSAADADLTPVRRGVLEVLRSVSVPMTAYEVMADLKKAGRTILPTSIYRVLDALIEAGLVHRIETTKAYVACQCPGADHQPAFLVCATCRRAEEVPMKSVSSEVSDALRERAFSAARHATEVLGYCAACTQAAGHQGGDAHSRSSPATCTEPL